LLNISMSTYVTAKRMIAGSINVSSLCFDTVGISIYYGIFLTIVKIVRRQ